MLTVLMVGGCICIPDEENRLNNLAGVINDMRVNWATLTPTVVRFLEPAMVPGLETIVLAGEAMSQSNLDTWSRIVIPASHPHNIIPLTPSRISLMPTVRVNALSLHALTPTLEPIAIRRILDFPSVSAHGLWIQRTTTSFCQLAVWVNYSLKAQLWLAAILMITRRRIRFLSTILSGQWMDKETDGSFVVISREILFANTLTGL